MLYYLFAAKNWGLHDLKALYEARDGWMEVIRAFAAFHAERRSQGLRW